MSGQQDEHGTSTQQSSHVEIVSRSGKELVVEASDEASQCLDRVGGDDINPVLLLDWNPGRVSAAVEVANRDRPPLPSWMPGYSYPITVEGLKLALTRYIGAADASGNTVGSILIGPNSFSQLIHVGSRFSQLLMDDPFFAHICGPASCRPLAAIYIFADGKRKNTAVAMSIPPLLGGDGVQAFD